MQFGGGNFLRAFSLWMIEKLNKESAFNAGVAVIKPTPFGDYQLLKEQEGNYHVLLNGLQKGSLVRSLTKINCIDKIVNPYTDWNDYLALAESPTIRFIISNTTEAGIVFNPKDSSTDTPPKEFPAKLTLWLYHRYLHFNGSPTKGCLILPCELIPDNGQVLEKCIISYANSWGLEKGFIQWVETSNYFYNTLVDRIVSGFPKKEAKEVFREIGAEDPLLVAGEYYHSWILNGPIEFENEWPTVDDLLNIQVVDDLEAYRKMKVRLLNGAHTILVPMGLLSGISTVREAVENPVLHKFLLKVLEEDVIPSLDIDMRECDVFTQNVIERFKNPSIEHQLSSISLNSISKFKTRLLPSIEAYIQKGEALPVRLVAVWAALLLFYRGGNKENKITLRDDAAVISYFKKLWEVKEYEEITLNVLSNKSFWDEDYSQDSNLVELLSNYMKQIDEKGVQWVMKSLS